MSNILSDSIASFVPHRLHLFLFDQGENRSQGMLVFSTTERTGVYFVPRGTPRRWVLTLTSVCPPDITITGVYQIGGSALGMHDVHTAIGNVNGTPRAGFDSWRWWDWTCAALQEFPEDSIDWGHIGRLLLRHINPDELAPSQIADLSAAVLHLL